VRDGDLTHRGQAPLPVDLAGHFKEVARALLPALIIALIVGGAVFLARTTFAAKEYAASIYTQITPTQTPVPGDAYVEQLRAPFMGLAHDSDVLNQVLAQTDTGWDPATLDAHVTLAAGPSPQLLIFTAAAGSPQQAREIVEAMVATVSQAAQANFNRDVGKQLEQVRATIATEEASSASLSPDDPARAESDRRLADLRTQLDTLQRSGGDRLSVLAVPQQSLAPVAPKPVAEALVAGLVALIVAAELIVVCRGRLGKRPNRTWARRVAHRNQAAFDPAKTVTLPTLAAAEIARQTRDGHEVLVLTGQGAVFDAPAIAGRANGHRRTLIERPLDDNWWRDIDTDAIGVALVIVTTRSADRRAAEQALHQLQAMHTPTWLVLQYPEIRSATVEPKTAGRAAPPGRTDNVPNGSDGDVAPADEPRTGAEHDVR